MSKKPVPTEGQSSEQTADLAGSSSHGLLAECDVCGSTKLDPIGCEWCASPAQNPELEAVLAHIQIVLAAACVDIPKDGAIGRAMRKYCKTDNEYDPPIQFPANDQGHGRRDHGSKTENG